jgi:ATP-dependent Lon protease
VIKSDPPSNVGDNPKPGVGGSLKLTGQMGDVMKESASIAMTVGRKKLTDYMSNNEVREREGERKERKRESFTSSTLLFHLTC